MGFKILKRIFLWIVFIWFNDYPNASPHQKEPIRLLEERLDCTFSTKEKQTLKDIILKDDNKEDILKFIRDFLSKNESKVDESIIPDVVPSFLEMTQNYAPKNTKMSPRKIDLPTDSKQGIAIACSISTIFQTSPMYATFCHLPMLWVFTKK